MSGRRVLDLVGHDQDSEIMAPAGPVAEQPVAVVVMGRLPSGRPGPLSGLERHGFTLGDVIGEGGMGTVYAAWHHGPGRVVAFKVLVAAAESLWHVRFANEARAAARIDSPHVVRVIDCGDDDPPWLAMEYVAGRSLAEELRARLASGARFTPAEAAGLIVQAARGLEAAHRCRLVHRDIKSANLLLAGDGTLKIADFGLVRSLDAQTLTAAGTVLGTPQYIAPEQGRGLEADHRSDLYSLGVVLYELLTMRPPFSGDSPESLIFQHNYAEPVLPARLNPDVPQDLQAVCLTCLQKDPARRFADAAAMVRDLDRLCHGLAPITAVFAPGQLSTGADDALRRQAGWRRRWWPLAGAAALLVVLAAGWWWWDARRSAAAELRLRLQPLALVQPVPATASADLERLAALTGEDDPVVAQGRDKLARLAGLAARLDIATADAEGGTTAASEVQAGIAALVELVGPAGDPRLGRWSAWAADADGRLQRLRARLGAQLVGKDTIGDVQRADLDATWQAFSRLAAADDRDRQGWAAVLARSDAAKQSARAELARLDDPAVLPAEALPGLRAAESRLGALAPDDPDLPRRRQRLAAETADHLRYGAALGRLLQIDPLNAADREALAATGGWLEARGALGEESRLRLRLRLADADAELAALRQRLSALDAPRTPPAGTREALARYEVLAGFRDAQALGWRQRWDEICDLQSRLGPADRVGSPPPEAAADVARLAALVGADDPQVMAWSGRLAAIARLATRITQILNAVNPPANPRLLSADAESVLLVYAGLVGAEADLARQLRARIDAERRQSAEVSAWEDVLVLADPAAADGQLAGLRRLIGDTPLTHRGEVRLRELGGPVMPAWAATSGRDQHGRWVEARLGSLTLRLRWMPPARFTMGSPPDEAGRDPDEAAVQVRLTRGIWIAERECPQDLFTALTGTNPSRHPVSDGPVEQVSHADAESFCRLLSDRLAAEVRLPTEAEWECAMRAGSTAPWGSVSTAQLATAIVHGSDAPRRCASGPPNLLGLHDGPGNVREWCAGNYGPPPGGDLVIDPAPATGSLRVARGGSWGDPLAACRLANRAALDPAVRSCYLGFRIVIAEGP